MLALVAGCGGNRDASGGQSTERRTGDAMNVRKQVYELTLRDLEQFPVWEFALDEEGQPGQDEATVKPRPDLASGADLDDGLLVVRAEFTAADGSTFAGFVTPDPDDDLSARQPSVVTKNGHVQFWFGIVEPEPPELEKRYAALGEAGDDLFPLSYRTSVPVAGKPLAGQVAGFMYLDDAGESRTIG
jgi:hypothetical protein